MQHVWGTVAACTGFQWGNQRERDQLEDPDVNGSIILRWIFSKRDVGGMDWIELAQDRDRWRALRGGTGRADNSAAQGITLDVATHGKKQFPIARHSIMIETATNLEPKHCLLYEQNCTFRRHHRRCAATINPLKTKRRLLYLKTQFAPRSKHFSSRL